jgi:transcriptional regulator with XRE-family HTH domain
MRNGGILAAAGAMARGGRPRRRNRSLTQRQVAEAMGMSGPRVSDVERGNLDTVSISVVHAHVEALSGKLKVTAEFDDSSYLVA